MEARQRQYKGASARVVTGLSALVVLYCLAYVGHVWEFLGIHIYGGVHRSLVLTYILLMTILLFPARKGASSDKLPWYDVILLLLTLVSGGYLVLNTKQIDVLQMPANTLQQVLAMIMVVVVLECARRAVGWVFTVLGFFFLTYPFYAQFLPGIFRGGHFTFQRVMTTVYMSSTFGINGMIMQILATIILTYIVFGVFLKLSGGGQFFIDLATGLLGRFRGGPAKVAVVASGFFASMSGSAVANVVTTGVVTIPLMKSIGYKPHFAGAVEAAASTGGQFMPPVMASVAFIMADFLGIDYYQVCLAALIPAVLYYVALLIMVDLEAGKNNLGGLAREMIPSVRRTLASGWIYLVPIITLLVLLLGFQYRAATAGIYTLVVMIIVSFFKRESRIGPRRFVRGLDEGGRGILEVGVAIGVAGILISTLQLTGIGYRVTGALVELSGGSVIALLLLSAAIALIMGMGTGPATIYITLALLVAPALIQSGIEPVAAHLFLVFLACASMITPPVALAAFVAATIAGSSLWRTGFTAVRLGAVAFLLPFIFVYDPVLLMIGPASNIVMSVVTALVGILLLSIGFQGYFLGQFGPFARVLLIAAGVVMVIPGWITDAIGFTAGALILLWQVVQVRKLRPPD